MSNRESILARLETVLAGVDGVDNVYRNVDRINETQLPAIVLSDADEKAVSGHVGGRPAASPAIVEMTPDIYVRALDDGENIGPKLNELLDGIVAAVRTDTELLALTHNGDIRYEGCETGLARGRSMSGEMSVFFAFQYVHR